MRRRSTCSKCGLNLTRQLLRYDMVTIPFKKGLITVLTTTTWTYTSCCQPPYASCWMQSTRLSKDRETLVRNISCLFKTAQQEIQRKDAELK